MQQKGASTVHVFLPFPEQFKNVSRTLKHHLLNSFTVMDITSSPYVFRPSSAFSGLSKLSFHSSIALSFPRRTVDLKTHHIQCCHAECLMLSPSRCTHHSLPLVQTRRKPCPVSNAIEVSRDSPQSFLLDYKENNPNGTLIDGTVQYIKRK